MATHVYGNRVRLRTRPRSHSRFLVSLSQGIEAFVVYGLLPAVLVIAYLTYATVEAG